MCSGSMTIVKLMVQELTVMSHLATQGLQKKIKEIVSCLLYVLQWFNTNIVVSESADKTSVANPALPMVEVTVLLVVKKC